MNNTINRLLLLLGVVHLMNTPPTVVAFMAAPLLMSPAASFCDDTYGRVQEEPPSGLVGDTTWMHHPMSPFLSDTYGMVRMTQPKELPYREIPTTRTVPFGSTTTKVVVWPRHEDYNHDDAVVVFDMNAQRQRLEAMWAKSSSSLPAVKDDAPAVRMMTPSSTDDENHHEFGQPDHIVEQDKMELEREILHAAIMQQGHAPPPEQEQQEEDELPLWALGELETTMAEMGSGVH
eukprot:scaffold96_cov172-Amphora_coffeaeformis.AAC.4